MREPTLPTDKKTPITPGDMSISRTRKTRMMEKVMLKKKFDVAVQPA